MHSAGQEAVLVELQQFNKTVTKAAANTKREVEVISKKAKLSMCKKSTREEAVHRGKQK